MKKQNVICVMCGFLLTALIPSCPDDVDTEPRPPKNLRVTVDDEWWIYTIRWDAVPGAAEYYFYKWVDYDYDDPRYPHFKFDDDDYDITDTRRKVFYLERETTRHFAVKTVKNGKVSVLSNIVTVAGDPTVPKPVYALLESGGPSGPSGRGYFEKLQLSSKPQPFKRSVHTLRKAAWEAQKINKYRFTAAVLRSDIRPDAPIPPYYTVTVFPDKKPEMISDQENTYDDRDPFGDRLYLEGKTIDEFFVSIPEILADYPPNYKWYIVYNTKYHYPELLGYEGYFPYSNYPTFYIHNFEVLEE